MNSQPLTAPYTAAPMSLVMRIWHLKLPLRISLAYYGIVLLSLTGESFLLHRTLVGPAELVAFPGILLLFQLLFTWKVSELDEHIIHHKATFLGYSLFLALFFVVLLCLVRMLFLVLGFPDGGIVPAY